MSECLSPRAETTPSLEEKKHVNNDRLTGHGLSELSRFTLVVCDVRTLEYLWSVPKWNTWTPDPCWKVLEKKFVRGWNFGNSVVEVDRTNLASVSKNKRFCWMQFRIHLIFGRPVADHELFKSVFIYKIQGLKKIHTTGLVAVAQVALTKSCQVTLVN